MYGIPVELESDPLPHKYIGGVRTTTVNKDAAKNIFARIFVPILVKPPFER
jgi:hypothetical protein